jgi:hypothetical protein
MTFRLTTNKGLFKIIFLQFRKLAFFMSFLESRVVQRWWRFRGRLCITGQSAPNSEHSPDEQIQKETHFKAAFSCFRARRLDSHVGRPLIELLSPNSVSFVIFIPGISQNVLALFVSKEMRHTPDLFIVLGLLEFVRLYYIFSQDLCNVAPQSNLCLIYIWI